MRYNIEEDKWILCDDEVFASSEIEDIPVSIIMKIDKECYIWCNKHMEFEKIIEFAGISYKTETCNICGFPAYFYVEESGNGDIYFHTNDKGKWRGTLIVPYCWIINNETMSNTVKVSLKFCQIQVSHVDTEIPFVPYIREISVESAFYNLETGDVHYSGDIMNYPVDVMGITVDVISNIFQDKYGIKPKGVKEKIHRERGLRAFIYRPYDLNCYELKPYFSDLSIIPRDCKDSYYILCEYLKISPPKGLKKFYSSNPYSIIMYKAFMELGIKDYNLVRDFFYNTYIGEINFSYKDKFHFPFLSDGIYYVEADNDENYKKNEKCKGSDMISQEEIDKLLGGGDFVIPRTAERNRFDDWNKLKFIFDWVKSKKGEKIATKRLLKYTMSRPRGWRNDILNMLYYHFDSISEKRKNEFIDKDCTIKLHDELVYEVNHLDYMRREFKYYYPYELDWECEINGYKFELPKFTDEMADVGREMKNCVASYINDIIMHDCTIMVVRKNNACVACIYIGGSMFGSLWSATRVIQALGYNNKKLEGEVRQVVIYWMYKMLLENETDDLSYNEIKNIKENDFNCIKPSGGTPYFMCSVRELLDTPLDKRNAGFYSALATKVVTEDSYEESHVIKASKYNMEKETLKDDVEFVREYWPQLECVALAAKDGNGEAQRVMCKLYKCYPSNEERSRFWFEQAKMSNEPDIPSLLRRLN